MRVAIIGGGISGLTLANFFDGFNLDYTIFERSNQFKDVGAGIGLSSSTLKILNTINLQNDILSRGNIIKKAIILDKHSRIIKKLPIESEGVCISRSNLISVLTKNINFDRVSFNTEVVDFNFKGDSVTLFFNNHSKQEFDFVFACDGINSFIRKRIYPNIQTRYSGQTVWRGISKNYVSLNHNSQFYCEYWGDNLRFATIPLSNNTFYWYACKEACQNEVYNPKTIKKDLINLFSNYDIEVINIINNTGKIIRNDMSDLKPHNCNWYSNNIIFLGDSIHATTPNLAQGGCQAIEDAYAISILINRYGCSNEAFEKYFKLRNEKVNYIVSRSWSYGKISHQSTLISEIITKHIIKLIPNFIFKNQYKKLIDLSYLDK